MRGKADRVGLALGVPLDQEGGALCCDPTLCLEVGFPLLSRLLSLREGPAPLHCILPSHCLNSSQAPFGKEGHYPNRLN